MKTNVTDSYDAANPSNVADSPNSRNVANLPSATGKAAPRRSRTLLRAVSVLGGVVGLAAAAFFGFNASVSHSFDTVAATLNTNLTAITKDEPNLDALTVSQQQVAAQLDELEANAALQLPQVKEHIATAADVSAQLDAKIAELKQEQTGTQTQADVTTDKDDSSDSSSSDSDSDSSDEQTEEQKEQQKKLDALLKQNKVTEEESEDAASDEDSTTTSPDSSTTKPW